MRKGPVGATLIFVFSLSAILVADEFDVEERGVFEAVIHDPRLLNMCGGKIQLEGRTYLWDSPIWAENAKLFPAELIESSRTRNRRVIGAVGVVVIAISALFEKAQTRR